MNTRKYVKIDHSKLSQLAGEGMCPRQIAQSLGTGVSSVRAALSNDGIPHAGAYKKYTKEQLQEMANKGMLQAEIAKTLGLSQSGVSRAFKKCGTVFKSQSGYSAVYSDELEKIRSLVPGGTVAIKTSHPNFAEWLAKRRRIDERHYSYRAGSDGEYIVFLGTTGVKSVGPKGNGLGGTTHGLTKLVNEMKLGDTVDFNATGYVDDFATYVTKNACKLGVSLDCHHVEGTTYAISKGFTPVGQRLTKALRKLKMGQEILVKSHNQGVEDQVIQIGLKVGRAFNTKLENDFYRIWLSPVQPTEVTEKEFDDMTPEKPKKLTKPAKVKLPRMDTVVTARLTIEEGIALERHAASLDVGKSDFIGNTIRKALGMPERL